MFLKVLLLWVPILFPLFTPLSLPHSHFSLPIPKQNKSLIRLSSPLTPLPHPFSNRSKDKMSKFCPSNTTDTQFSSLLLSDFILFCSFILSHPLYFSYFIFFSPYLFKLFSFLSPLVITTSLLLLALLTGFPGFSPPITESKVSFLLTAYNTTVKTLRTKLEDEREEFQGHFEMLEAFMVALETCPTLEATGLKFEENGVQVLEAPVAEGSSHGVQHLKELDLNTRIEATELNLKDEVQVLEAGDAECSSPSEFHEALTYNLEENRLEGLLEEELGVPRSIIHGQGEENEVKCTSTESEKVEEEKVEEEKVEESLSINGSNALNSKISESVVKDVHTNGRAENFMGLNLHGNTEYMTSKVVENSETLMGSNLGNFGSMRKEKEWKRTLACKLFEERHNANGGSEGEGEGMDLLWEAYESDTGKMQGKNKTEKKGKKNGTKYNHEEDEEEEEMDVQLCCLQALKFSSGKMNLGMGRPNLVRITKALKGFGWLHHVAKNGKKGYN